VAGRCSVLRDIGFVESAGSRPGLPSRWAGVSAKLPPALEHLAGPGEGVVELPRDLAWSGDRRFDLADPGQRYLYHMTILTSAVTREHYTGWLNAGLLCGDWGRLRLPRPLREIWQKQSLSWGRGSRAAVLDGDHRGSGGGGAARLLQVRAGRRRRVRGQGARPRRAALRGHRLRYRDHRPGGGNRGRARRQLSRGRVHGPGLGCWGGGRATCSSRSRWAGLTGWTC
jgi:hypothetical protein